MIALKNGLPLLRDDKGLVSPFDILWLRSTLNSAAAKAGYQGWWLVDDLAEGITSYLRQNHIRGVIDLLKLENVIQAVLCDVGYGEIAAKYQTVMPCHKISLVQCLRQISQDDHSRFFDRLGKQIAELNATKLKHVHFSDLEACLTGLAGLRPVTRGDGEGTLLHQLVTFVRERVQALRWHSPIWCSIS